jgi:hypothetical protein
MSEAPLTAVEIARLSLLDDTLCAWSADASTSTTAQ